MTTTFRSTRREGRFRSEGFAIVDGVGPEEAARLRHLVLGHEGVSAGTGCSSTTDSSDVELRRELHGLISSVLGPVAGPLLTGHRSFTSSVVVKWPGDDSAMPGHRDWTFVDETRFRSVSFWMPLQDARGDNGALRLVPGSQRPPNRLRTNPGDLSEAPPPGLPWQPLTVVAGSCAVFDHALLHDSPPNRTDEPRVALVLAFAPTGAGLLHHWRHDDGTVERFAVDDEDFFRRCRHGVAPTGPGLRSLGSVSHPVGDGQNQRS